MRYIINSKDNNHNPSEYIVDGTVIFTLVTGWYSYILVSNLKKCG